MNITDSSTAIDGFIENFLAHQRTLGRSYKTEEYILLGLRRFLLNDDELDLDQGAFDRWCNQLNGLCANTRRSRQLVVRKLCLYRQRSQPDCFVPDSLHFARPQPYRQPVLIEPEQIAALLMQTGAVTPTLNSPLRGPVLRMAIILLYTAGLRRGELVRLTLDDVDANEGVLRIRESKFHKSRLVPLSSSARLELRQYLRIRAQRDCPQCPDSALLCNQHSRVWRPYTGPGLRRGICQLLKASEVHDAYGRQPRVHDFRHSFAVQALIRLYRTDADVQSALPHLALYMGHVSIVSTAYYLHFIPALAALASEKFEDQCAYVLEEQCNE